MRFCHKFIMSSSSFACSKHHNFLAETNRARNSDTESLQRNERELKYNVQSFGKLNTDREKAEIKKLKAKKLNNSLASTPFFNGHWGSRYAILTRYGIPLSHR